MGCSQPITLMLTFSTSAEGHSGEVLGLRITMNHLARMIGPWHSGRSAQRLEYSPMFWINALMLFSGGALAKSGRIGQKRKSR